MQGEPLVPEALDTPPRLPALAPPVPPGDRGVRLERTELDFSFPGWLLPAAGGSEPTR